jgi:RNA polymerase sigma-B factor
MPRNDEREPLEDLDAMADAYTSALTDADGRARRRLRDEFLGQTLPLARRLARRYRGRGELIDDLEQVARLGLVKTVDRYDPERGSFTAYAIITITGEIKRHFRNHTWGVHVPRSMQDLSLEIGRVANDMTTRLARRPTAEEIAEHLGLDPQDVRRAQASAAAYSPSSLNAPVGDASGIELGDLFGDGDPALGMIDDETTLQRLLRRLPARERQMLALRFYGNLSQTEIAEKLGISQMHVSRLLGRALSWLREAMLSDTPPIWAGGDDAEHRLRMAVTYDKDAVVACVRGEVDRDNADQLRGELLTAIGECNRSRGLTVDLAGVPLLDAAGIAVLIAVHEAARVRAVAVRVVGLQPFVAQIAKMSGLRDMVES